MTSRHDAAVAAARACIGTPFRPQGRVPGLALDCVGLVLVAVDAAGRVRPCAWPSRAGPQLPAYRLSGDHDALVLAQLAAFGCRPVLPRPGTIMMLAPGGRARHLGILTPAGLVHAHAGLRRVVEGPVDPGWLVLGCFDLPDLATPQTARD